MAATARPDELLGAGVRLDEHQRGEEERLQQQTYEDGPVVLSYAVERNEAWSLTNCATEAKDARTKGEMSEASDYIKVKTVQ